MQDRILVVEDSPTQAAQLTAHLTNAGYETTTASSGERALEILESDAFDAIISDVMMPGAVDGYELCRRVKQGPRRETPVMLLTSLSDPMDIIRGLECGADNFLTKPYDPPLLLERLKILLATRRARSQHRVSAGVTVLFMGREFTISSDREQILDLLVTTFEEAVRQNRELRQREDELRAAKAQISRYAAALEGMLHNTEQRFAKVFDVSPVGIAITDALTGAFVDVNDAFLETAGYPRNEVLGKTAQDLQLLAGDGHERLTAAVRGGKSLRDIEVIVRSKDGDLRHVLTALEPIEVGGDQAMLWLVHDISNRKQAEDELRMTQGRLQQVLASSAAVIYALKVTPEGYVSNYVSDNVLTILGYEIQEALAPKWWVERVHPSEIDEVLSHQKKLLENNVVVREYRFLHKSGQYRWIRDESRLIRNAQGTPQDIVGVWVDVTAQKKLEEQLFRAQKMEAVGRLAGGVAHDFNNILTAIFGYTDLVLVDLPPDSPARPDINEVRKAAERASALTKQLLAFSRQQVLEPIALNMNENLRDLARMLERLLGEDVELRLNLAADAGNVRADPNQIQQVVMNLVVNARDAMPSGGSLLIETTNVDLGESHGELQPPVTPGRYVMLAVSDTGTGMDAETRSHIFEPFFTTKEKGRGTGLGLSTVYGIVKQSGGYIWVYSEPGRGTTFKIYLPRVDAPVEAIEAPRETPSLSGSETILLVEDDAMLRPLARALLTRLGYSVLDADGARTAIELATKHEGPIQLLVTDVVMPEVSGPEMARALARIRPEMKVLYLSGYTDDAIVRHGMLTPGLNFLQKPFTPDVLASKIRGVLDHR